MNASSHVEPRNGPLSRRRIVEAAIELLDRGGEGGLTFRALSARMATGAGAIYWHVADKQALLAACADAVVGRVMAGVDRNGEPRGKILAIASGMFDAIDAHPWVGSQLTRGAEQNAMLELFEAIGQQLQALGVPETKQFDAASALVSYMLGVAGQNAANARLVPPGTDRSAYLATVVAHWTHHDPKDYPFVHRIAGQLQDHDDRAQFMAGIAFILTGLQPASVA